MMMIINLMNIASVDIHGIFTSLFIVIKVHINAFYA